jgi:conjugal transfer mating pair stabilization protein TraG
MFHNTGEMTIHVLGFGEIYVQLLNAMAAFMKQDGFSGLLKITALIGIIMASVGYLKQRDPLVYAKWVVGFVLVSQVVILPKTSVAIYDIAAQNNYTVSNVPVVFAVFASLITTVGVGLAEHYDELLSLPDELVYTKTGALFGSKIIQASRDFRIINPQLKSDMNGYLRNCVVGDIRLNHKYSVGDLTQSTNIINLITSHASPVRMTNINGKKVTCETAARPEGADSLRAQLTTEIKNAYTFFGINLFGRQKETNYEALFETRLKSSFEYYQHMTDTSADIFMQSMMINAIGDGITDYQAFTDSTAGVVNNQVTKSQVQHRWSWAIAGQKAAWFLPLLHTLLSVLLFGIFPVIMVMATLPNGITIFKGYVQFFISLQFWPVLFAILNAAMTLYGASETGKHGAITMVNIDKIDELHGDISGVAGYLMLMIPFIAKGLVSNLSDAFNNLATSMTGHLQGSAMSVANDAASASFSMGQTSFYNTSANNYSANKHDNNWTHMHGMSTEQFSTGVTKTHTGSGDTVFDVSAGMTKSALSINATDALNGSLSDAAEASKQASINDHQSMQTSLSNFAHKALQLSKIAGHDRRLGEGLSSTESGEFRKGLSSMSHIASDVASRFGISKDEAFAGMTGLQLGGQVTVGGQMAVSLGAFNQWVKGRADVSGNLSGKYGRSSTSTDRSSDGHDASITAREASDFSSAYAKVQGVVNNHHFDDTHSEGASLFNQMGADLRHAEVASKNYDAALSRSHRISQASSYVQSHGSQITTNWDQAFLKFVGEQLGKTQRDALYAHPGEPSSLKTLEAQAHDFVLQKREEIIATFGGAHQGALVDKTYQQGVQHITEQSAPMEGHFNESGGKLTGDATQLSLGIDDKNQQSLQERVHKGVSQSQDTIHDKQIILQDTADHLARETSRRLSIGKLNADRGVFFMPFRNNADHNKE